MTEGLSLVDIRKVNLYRRDGHGFQRVQNGYAGMGISSRIDYNALVFAIGGLDSKKSASTPTSRQAWRM